MSAIWWGWCSWWGCDECGVGARSGMRDGLRCQLTRSPGWPWLVPPSQHNMADGDYSQVSPHTPHNTQRPPHLPLLGLVVCETERLLLSVQHGRISRQRGDRDPLKTEAQRYERNSEGKIINIQPPPGCEWGPPGVQRCSSISYWSITWGISSAFSFLTNNEEHQTNTHYSISCSISKNLPKPALLRSGRRHFTGIGVVIPFRRTRIRTGRRRRRGGGSVSTPS